MTAMQIDGQLDLVHALNSDPGVIAERERERILDAMETDAKRHNGVVSPNRVRALLTNDHGLTVRPQRLSAAYGGPWLERIASERSDDLRSRNRGTVLGLYRWLGRSR